MSQRLRARLLITCAPLQQDKASCHAATVASAAVINVTDSAPTPDQDHRGNAETQPTPDQDHRGNAETPPTPDQELRGNTER